MRKWRIRAPYVWLFLAGATYGLMLWQDADGPFDAAARRYGANWPGDVPVTLQFVAVELAILVLLIRPWSYRRSAGRSLAGFLLFGAWGVANLIACMHCGLVGIGHGFWLLLVSAGLLGATVVSGLARVREHARAERTISASGTGVAATER